jgi:hypothetical protein
MAAYCTRAGGRAGLLQHSESKTGHAFGQNLRRGHDELGADAHRALRTAAAFTELVLAI